MNIDILIQEILNRGKEKFDDLEVYLVLSKSIEIKVFNGEIDKYSISQTGGLSLRGLKEGKMGYSYTEKLDQSSIDMVLDEALENTKYIDISYGDDIYSGYPEYKTINNFNEKLEQAKMDERITFVKAIEEKALSMDKRITNVQSCMYHEFQQERYIYNTRGVRLMDKGNGAFAYISVIASQGDDTKTGMGFRIFKDLSKVSPNDIAKEAVDESLSMLKASPLKTGTYPIIIKNLAFAELLSAFSTVFSADNAQKGLSLFNGKVGKKITSDLLTIVDDPFMDQGFASKAFDDEGTATLYKKVIDKGVLTTLLHTWKTARKDGIESTGNGSRPSYKSSLGISPSNFYVKSGNISFENMIKEMKDGVYITDLQGLHSGLNQVSGDFSLSAMGYEIRDGELIRPVNQITIAGNFFDLLKNIVGVADDLRFTMPDNGYFGSPSIRIKELSVAGEN